jgi:hypothetical protein
MQIKPRIKMFKPEHVLNHFDIIVTFKSWKNMESDTSEA